MLPRSVRHGKKRMFVLKVKAVADSVGSLSMNLSSNVVQSPRDSAQQVFSYFTLVPVTMSCPSHGCSFFHP